MICLGLCPLVGQNRIIDPWKTILLICAIKLFKCAMLQFICFQKESPQIQSEKPHWNVNWNYAHNKKSIDFMTLHNVLLMTWKNVCFPAFFISSHSLCLWIINWSNTNAVFIEQSMHDDDDDGGDKVK